MDSNPPRYSLTAVRALVRRGIRLTLGPRAGVVLHRAYHAVLRRAGRFTPAEDQTTLQIIRFLAARSTTILDIGANTGRYAHDFLRVTCATSQLYAFEPNPAALDLLRMNAGNDARVTIFPVALSSVAGRAALAVPLDISGNPVSALSHLSEASPSETTIEVELCALDSLVSAGHVVLRPPVFAKIDVEGHEPAVLSGAGSLLREGAAIYFECQREHLVKAGSRPAALWRQLTQAGYEVVGRADLGFRRYSQPVDGLVNYLALPGGVLPKADMFSVIEIKRAISTWRGAGP